MLKDNQTWNDCAKDCPGMNKGRLWTKEEIEKNKSGYVQNTPLKKQEVEDLIKSESEKSGSDS
jgi:hypothetical protein